MVNGGGYPRFDYPRECHQASRLVHVCDVYDALRTNRPYRSAWPAEKVLTYITERSGSEFDADAARAFVKMMAEWEPKMAQHEAPAAAAAPSADVPPAAPSAGAGQG
jgi:putative two-component system response regulator